MRYLLLMWVLPIAVFGSWYGLSANDMNFGYFFLSRQMHDFFFQLYAHTLGVPAAEIPGMIASALIFDSFLVLGIVAYKMRKSWWPWVAPYVVPIYNWISPVTDPVVQPVLKFSARIADSLSRHPWRIKLAATWSTFVARFRRDKSALIMARSAATVDSRSSQ